MRRMLRSGGFVAVAGAVLALSGCAFGPDPAVGRDRALAVFDDLVAGLASVDPTVLRTVEELPATNEPCGEAEETQLALVARGALSVQAADGAAGAVLTDLADVLPSGDWDPVTAPGEAERAWSSHDGVTVTMTDATPVIVVAVFAPCGSSVDVPLGTDGGTGSPPKNP